MTRLSLIIISLLLSLSSNSQSLYWDSEIQLPGVGFNRPRMVVNRSGQPVISWSDISSGKIYVSVLNNSVASNPVMVTLGATMAYAESWTSHEIAAFGDTIYIVFKLKPEATGGCYLVKSINGGLTFSDTVRVDPRNGNVSWLPTVTTDQFGNPVIAYMDYDAGWIDPRYVSVLSFDGGDTFNNPVNATKGISPGEVCDCCPATLCTEGSNRFFVFRNNQSNLRTIWASRSSDNGLTYTQADSIDYTSSYSNQCLATGPHSVIKGDSLLTVWMGAAGSVRRAYISSVSKNDLSIGTFHQISPNVPASATLNYPRISTQDSVIVITWQQALSGNTDIFFTYTTSTLNNLVQPDTVNDYRTGHQLNPSIVFNDNLFHFVWQDNSRSKIIYKRGSFDQSMLSVTNLEAKRFEVYPNPSSGNMTIANGAPGSEYSVYNINGTLVKNGVIKSEQEFMNLDELISGTYLLKIRSKVKEESRIIIVQ